MRRLSLAHLSTSPLTLDDPTIIRISPKASALDVEAMAAAGTFAHGPIGDGVPSPLVPDAWFRFHQATCAKCPPSSPSPLCYYARLDGCLRYGWDPQLTGPIEQLRPYHGNYPQSQAYNESCSNEVAKLLANGAICPLDSVGTSDCAFTPLNCVVKNSDRQRVVALLNEHFHDDATLRPINAFLEQHGYPPVKIRTVFDVTVTGVNAVMEKPPHTLASIDDHLGIVTQGCFLVKKDISRYYNCFPLAPSVFDDAIERSKRAVGCAHTIARTSGTVG